MERDRKCLKAHYSHFSLTMNPVYSPHVSDRETNSRRHTNAQMILFSFSITKPLSLLPL